MTTNKNKGCGCSRLPISLIIAILGGGYWWFIAQGNITKVTKLLPDIQLPDSLAKPLRRKIAVLFPGGSAQDIKPSRSKPSSSTLLPSPQPTHGSSTADAPVAPTPQAQPHAPIAVQSPPPVTAWERKAIRGIYLSRYQVTNNADEPTIRQRVRFYKSQGINTIIHGVWGNGCTMYNSEVMQQIFGAKSCPNQFQDRWLEWTIDEAHRQGMQVHAYFEKGIKIDKNSPIFELAISKKWLVPGVDRTYARVEHYVLDVDVPEVATFFKKMLAEFVTKYPKIDAVQWDDYLGYHAELPGKVDRTASLTKFVQQMISAMKAANPRVSFDLCHHNPYWAKRYFAADWEKWQVDRVFIQDYNEKNFKEELNYAVNYAGIAITDNQLHRLKELTENPKIKGILVFPLAGIPAETAARVRAIDRANSSTPAPTPKVTSKSK